MAAPEYVPVKPMDDVRTYEMAGRFDLNWRGIARYVLKKTGT